jgi:hypothetical protein
MQYILQLSTSVLWANTSNNKGRPMPQSYVYTIIMKHWHFCNNRYLLQDAKCCPRQVGDRTSPVRLFICCHWFIERVLLRKITCPSSFFYTFSCSHNDISTWILRIKIGPELRDVEPAYPSSYWVNTTSTCNPMTHGPSWETRSPLAVQILQTWRLCSQAHKIGTPQTYRAQDETIITY